MTYAIICDARKGEVFGIASLALVDRKLSKKYWWTSDSQSLILDYKDRNAAEFCAKRLKKNNARIVSIEIARKIISEQSRRAIEAQSEFDNEAAKADAEMGWDAHKGY